VGRSQGFSRLSVGFESDKKLAAIALADFPFADEMTSAWSHGAKGRSFEFDAGDVGGVNFFLMTVAKDDRGRFEVNPRDLCHREGLAMAVFEYDYDRPAIVDWARQSAGGSE
jgi:hypothetical protein